MTQPGDLVYVFRWNRHGRKDEPCAVEVRAKAMNSCLIRFADGYRMVTSRNALRRKEARDAKPTGMG
jgi:hypothetical protein